MEEFETGSLENFTYTEFPDAPPIDDYALTNIVIYSVLLYVGVCTNVWMLWSLYKTWEAGRAQFYLLGICVTDLLMICSHCPMHIGMEATITWQGGYIGCKIVGAFIPMSLIAGHFILIGFNLDNLITLIYDRSFKMVRILTVIVAVVLSIALCIPLVFIFQEETFGDYTVCRQHAEPLFARVSDFAIVIGTYCLPLLAILVLGGATLCTCCCRKDSNKDLEKAKYTDMKCIGRDIRMATAFNFLFLICRAPAGLSQLYFQFSNSFLMILHLIYNITTFLSVVYSCLIPIVYGVSKCMTDRRKATTPGL